MLSLHLKQLHFFHYCSLQREEQVKEETSVLELMSTDGAAELAGDKTKLTITRPLDPKTAEPEPVAPPPSKTGSSKKSK